MDVEINQEFISCCGPGEWVVCNCLSERDEYPLFTKAGDNLEFKETEEVEDSSDTASTSEDLSAPPELRDCS